VTDHPKQLPDAVPEPGAKPAGEIRARWAWVEAEVWTERMLTALEQGVLGGKWFSRRDKVYALPNLRRAFEGVKANGGAAGVDHVRVEEFERHLEANREKLAQSLRAIVPRRFAELGFPSRAARRNVRWEFRRGAIGGCRQHSAQCWSRSSSGIAQRKATGSV